MKITIEGVPVAQARMRHFSRGKFVSVYDPCGKEKKDIRFKMSQCLKNEYPEFKLLEHPRLTFVFYMPIPASTPKNMMLRHLNGNLKHEKKPDIDNLLKLYLDCMDGIFFEGDQKVCLAGAFKIYHEHPKTIIKLEEANQLLTFQEIALF